jgi:hypothetical protein
VGGRRGDRRVVKQGTVPSGGQFGDLALERRRAARYCTALCQPFVSAALVGADDVPDGLARSPEFGPLLVRVLPARDDGRGRNSDEATHATPEQVVRKLREAERMLGEGKEIAEVAKELEVSENTFHRWRAQYGGMKADDVMTGSP